MKTTLFTLLVAAAIFLPVAPLKAQIGYQVALLNKATGEPRANESVNVNIKISDSTGKTVYSESQNTVTNDFGIISLMVGNENMFKDVDWDKLPFFISAEVNGILIGSSQIASVPVAEYAKNAGQKLTIEHLCKTSWTWEDEDSKISYVFYQNGKYVCNGVYYSIEPGWEKQVTTGSFYIVDNIVQLFPNDDYGKYLFYIPQLDILKYPTAHELYHRE